MKKILITLLACLFLVISTFAQTYSGGSGTETDPYLISSKADMETLATAVNGGKHYNQEYFMLTQNLTGITTVIGNSADHLFRGTFDGNEHAISVNINSTSYAGVFGYIGYSTIKNLGVLGSVASTSYAGGICGYADYETDFINCFNKAEIFVSSTSVSVTTGGICGYARPVGGKIVFSNCYNVGAVSADNVKNGATAGGILGGGSGTQPSATISISNCFNSGYITSSSNSSVTTGGICGSLSGDGTISNCYNIGNISAESLSVNKNAYVGGICGSGNCKISKCYNIGDITSNNEAGGIISGGGLPKPQISDCFVANSKILGNSSNIGRISCNIDYITVNNCYALSSILVNGATIYNISTLNKHGKDTSLSSFQSQSWIETNLDWDFDTVWKMSSSNSTNKGLPIFKNQQEQIPTYTITTSTGTGISATTGAGTYNSGATATVGCTVQSGYTFDGWYENSTKVSSSKSYNFTVTAARTLQA
jgi:uncharacterized repeat protein (TIGR02543 family)